MHTFEKHLCISTPKGKYIDNMDTKGKYRDNNGYKVQKVNIEIIMDTRYKR